MCCKIKRRISCAAGFFALCDLFMKNMVQVGMQICLKRRNILLFSYEEYVIIIQGMIITNM